MNPKPSKDLALNSGAYVLHALSDAEKTQFEALLRESEETRAEVTELADTAVVLGLSVTPVDPPASLRVSIMDAIATTPQFAPLPAAADDDTDHEVAAPLASVPLTAATATTAPATAPVVNLAEERARRRWYTRPMTTLAAAAAAVALIFGGGVAVNGVLQGQNAAAAASSINQIQAASDYQRRTVDVANGGSATVIWSGSLGRSAVLGSGMTKLSASKTYELWYIDKNGSTAAGTFNADGSATQSILLKGTMEAGDSIGITIEPAGGSTKPSTAPIALVTTA